MLRLTTKTTGLAMIVLWAAQNSAMAGDPVSNTRLLKDKVCDLRTAIEARAPYSAAAREVCELETAVEALHQQVTCPHDVDRLCAALRDVTQRAARSERAILRECSLRESHRVLTALDCTLRQLTRTQLSVDLLIARSEPVYGAPHTHLPIPGAPLPPSVAPYGPRTPGANIQLDVHARPQSPLATPSWYSNRAPHRDVNTTRLGHPPRTEIGPPALPGPPRGELGRAILALFLNEMAK